MRGLGLGNPRNKWIILQERHRYYTTMKCFKKKIVTTKVSDGMKSHLSVYWIVTEWGLSSAWMMTGKVDYSILVAFK